MRKYGKFSKPLVCADFRPHPHAHRTHFRNSARTHPHPSFCTRTRTLIAHLSRKKILKKNIFFLAKNGLFPKRNSKKIFVAKNGCADVRAHIRTLKVIYASTRTHISEKFSAPICTKIAARTHTKGLHIE